MATKSNRHMMVDMVCRHCGRPYQARKQRVDQGMGKFCSISCFNKHNAKGKNMMHVGKENAKVTTTGGKVGVHWFNPETMKRTNTSYAHWWWEMNKGPIPEGYKVHHKDGNPLNIEPNNFVLVTKKEIGKISGTKRIGSNMSDEIRRKISAAHKGKKLSKDHKNHISDSLRKRWEKGEFDLIHLGEHHRKWKGGATKRYSPEFIHVREFMFDRDKHKCRICGKSPKRLAVHHIDRNKENNELENLITLCSPCHHQIHENEHSSDPVILAFQSMMK